MSGIVERLRAHEQYSRNRPPKIVGYDGATAGLCRDAADTIEALLGALEGLYEACELRANADGGDFGEDIGPAAYLAEAAIAKARS
jgi:hypothetical protein